MSETIQGTKSSLYIKDQIPGIENSSDKFTHQSTQDLWDSRGASDVLIHALYSNTLLPILFEVGSVKRLIKSTGHGAVAGDHIRINNGASSGEEVAIIKVVDANFFVISKEINVAIGDQFFVMKPVTPTYNKDGSLNVIATQGPVIFNKNGAATVVNYNTVTPSSSEALPVNIVTVNGTGISTTVDLTGAQINVQLSDRGASPDSIQIGNGTNFLGINSNLEAKTHDADAITQLTNTNTLLNNVTALEGGTQPTSGVIVGGHTSGGLFRHILVGNTGAPQVDVVSSGLPSGASTSALQGTGNTSLGSIDTKTPALGQALAAASTPVVLTAAQVTTLAPPAAITGFALEDGNLNTITGRIPALGQALAINSTPVVLTALQVSALTPPAAITGFALDATVAKLNITQGSALGSNTGSMQQMVAIAGNPTYTEGTINPISQDLSGFLRVRAIGGSVDNADAVPVTAIPSHVASISHSYGFNGTSWDRLRSSITEGLLVKIGNTAAISTKETPQVASHVQSLTIDGVTAQSFTAPANARWVKIQADDDNLVNLKIAFGTTATATIGHKFAAGRSEDYSAVATISVIAATTATAQGVYITWGV